MDWGGGGEYFLPQGGKGAKEKTGVGKPSQLLLVPSPPSAPSESALGVQG